MGKHSKGLIGERPKTMHDLCAYKPGKKKDKQRDHIKMRALEQIVLRNKPDKIKQTIRELEQQERVGKLDHRGELKLIANKRILHKKLDKLNGGKDKPGTQTEEYRFTRADILNNRIAEPGDFAAPTPEPLAIPGYEPNSSLRPTGLPQHSRHNLVNEGTLSHAPMLYAQAKAPPTRAQRSEADPLTSECFENEMLHHIKPPQSQEESKRPQVLSTLLKGPSPASPVSKTHGGTGTLPASDNAKGEAQSQPVPQDPASDSKPNATTAAGTPNAGQSGIGGGRPERKLFVPSSVLAKKRQKEVGKDEPSKRPSAEQQSFRNVTKVPVPEGLLQFDLLDEEVDRDREDYTKFIREINH